MSRPNWNGSRFRLLLSIALILGLEILIAAPKGDAGQDSTPPPASAQPRQPKEVVMPEGDGKAIAVNACQECHSLRNLTSAHKDLDDWRDTVETMIDRGANVPPDKVDTLVQYLAKNFGPKESSTAPAVQGTPPASAQAPVPAKPKPGELPDGEGKVIATNACQACHGLENITDASKSLDDWRDTVQTMIDRGAIVPSDKIETLVQYLTKNFGPASATPAPGAASPSVPHQ